MNNYNIQLKKKKSFKNYLYQPTLQAVYFRLSKIAKEIQQRIITAAY
jgi:hypothetical protein